MIRLLLFFLLFTLACSLQARQQTVQVIDVSGNTQVKTLAPSGERQTVNLIGIKPIPDNSRLNDAGKKRLRTLVLGKTLQLETFSTNTPAGSTGLLSLGGTMINVRLLEDGLATVDENSLNALPLGTQQQFISAQEMAMQYQRGTWFRQRNTGQQRLHYPQWPANGLPSPFTSAPVYVPGGR